MKKIFLFVLIILLIEKNTAQAQTQINQKVENFTVLNLVDNKMINLNDYSKEQVLVLIFTSANCPYSKFYQTRIEKLAEKYIQSPVKFVFIVPETAQETQEEATKNAKNAKIPYLFDKGQVLTKRFSASKTPEVFVLQQVSAFFFIKYFGAIDDNAQSAEDVNNPYLSNAIQNLLDKKNVDISNQKPTGCIIKK
ncbi:MAG: hypothetical protein EAZ06_06090 [Cytophagales bacterium]|nr:MAG: hypothetical protein EAY69_07815 [Cytophagales bacterium]TAH29648.1 MAG: hypothetical protein EAZ06_06090 [Cytophagales bacterium]